MFWLMPLISGLGTWAATGDFKKGLMSGLLGAGIGGIAGALGGAGGAASGAADAVKAATDAASMSTNLATSGKGLIDAAHLGAKGAELAGLGQAGAQGIQAVGQGVNAAAGPSQNVMQMGADFLARKPVTAGLLLSSLTSAGMAETPETAEKTKGEPFADQHVTTDRNTIGFTGQPPPGPSTYVQGESFTPDNPYRYGQFEGEKMFFDSPGLERGPDGGLPPLPSPKDGEGEGEPDGILGILGRGSRTRRRYWDGGKIVGPGDGQSDSVPAKGPGFDIELSDGEVVWPADVVAALGAGSTDAGARRLTSAMSKIRTMSYGSSKQARRPGRVSL